MFVLFAYIFGFWFLLFGSELFYLPLSCLKTQNRTIIFLLLLYMNVRLYASGTKIGFFQIFRLSPVIHRSTNAPHTHHRTWDARQTVQHDITSVHSSCFTSDAIHDRTCSFLVQFQCFSWQHWYLTKFYQDNVVFLETVINILVSRFVGLGDKTGS
jgi:hypothetical protein